MTTSLGVWAAERGLIPTPLMRQGIRRLLHDRIGEFHTAPTNVELADAMRAAPVAVHVDRANDQHYEVPAEFFRLTLGPRLKYSGCFWPAGTTALADAEVAALEQVCDRARLINGQSILELGCGWGSLSLYMAERYPDSQIIAVSNSASQKAFIDSHGMRNLEVRTADMNDFQADMRFDRIVSVEMFEHMRNYGELFRRIASWLVSEGLVFVHIFCHRSQTYHFETDGPSNWLGRYFFTGGTMPSRDLFRLFSDHLTIESTWTQGGTHYARTARAWRENLELNRDRILPILSRVYGDDAPQWYHRWRIFFLSCEELFGFRNGEEWSVGHYLFTKT